METCDSGPGKVYQADRYCDGLLISLLIACPMRIKNLTDLVIGQHLVFDGSVYRLKLAATVQDGPAACRRGSAGADRVRRGLASGPPRSDPNDWKRQGPGG